jgi:hypothetical protein
VSNFYRYTRGMQRRIDRTESDRARRRRHRAELDSFQWEGAPRPFVHLYFDPGRSPRFASFRPGTPSCALCGAVKPRDPSLATRGCRGRVRIELRQAAP